MAGETILTVVGNLTDDPELRFTHNGTPYAKIRVASTARTYDKASGGWKDGEPLFLTCTAWREMAENIAESLTRGTRVVVTGRLKLSQWQTPEGEKRSMMQLDVDEIGPSLRWAQATVRKLSRTTANGTSNGGNGARPPQVEDPWAAPEPVGAPAGGRFDDSEPPF